MSAHQPGLLQQTHGRSLLPSTPASKTHQQERLSARRPQSAMRSAFPPRYAVQTNGVGAGRDRSVATLDGGVLLYRRNSNPRPLPPAIAFPPSSSSTVHPTLAQTEPSCLKRPMALARPYTMG